MTACTDLADMPEDEQISAIRAAIAEGLVVGVFVDNNEKADRYLRKIGPVAVLARKKDLVKGSVFLKLGPRVH